MNVLIFGAAGRTGCLLVKHAIVQHQSCVGVDESRGAAGWFTRLVGARVRRYELVDHESKEGLVRASTLDWTIVRPATLNLSERTGHYRVGESVRPGGLGWQPSISRADTAECLVRLATDPASIRKTLILMR